MNMESNILNLKPSNKLSAKRFLAHGIVIGISSPKSYSNFLSVRKGQFLKRTLERYGVLNGQKAFKPRGKR